MDESMDESMDETNFLVSSKDETNLLLPSKDENKISRQKQRSDWKSWGRGWRDGRYF
jgi:hypothetical protein